MAFFSAQISISSFRSQEMTLPSFIFNWISNINLLSFRGPFMSPSLPSKLSGVALKALLARYIIHPSESHIHIQWDLTKPERISSERFTRRRASWLIFCSAWRVLIPSHSFFKKKKWRSERDDVANCLQNIRFNIICQRRIYSVCTATRLITVAARLWWVTLIWDVTCSYTNRDHFKLIRQKTLFFK